MKAKNKVEMDTMKAKEKEGKAKTKVEMDAMKAKEKEGQQRFKKEKRRADKQQKRADEAEKKLKEMEEWRRNMADNLQKHKDEIAQIKMVQEREKNKLKLEREDFNKHRKMVRQEHKVAEAGIMKLQKNCERGVESQRLEFDKREHAVAEQEQKLVKLKAQAVAKLRQGKLLSQALEDESDKQAAKLQALEEAVIEEKTALQHQKWAAEEKYTTTRRRLNEVLHKMETSKAHSLSEVGDLQREMKKLSRAQRFLDGIDIKVSWCVPMPCHHCYTGPASHSSVLPLMHQPG